MTNSTRMISLFEQRDVLYFYNIIQHFYHPSLVLRQVLYDLAMMVYVPPPHRLALRAHEVLDGLQPAVLHTLLEPAEVVRDEMPD